MDILGFFRNVGSLIKKAIDAAKSAGLTDALIQVALPFVRDANAKFVDNEARREWVVAKLVSQTKVPESIARIVVELAFQIYRKEVSSKLGS